MTAADVKTMRQSMRCFWFGVAGLLPVAGAGLAWQALRLFKEIEGRGARVSASFSISVWLPVFVATPFIMAAVNWPPVAALALAVAGIDAAMRYKSWRAAAKETWNPAANWAWAGAALARAGLALSAVLALALLTRVFDIALFGTP